MPTKKIAGPRKVRRKGDTTTWRGPASSEQDAEPTQQELERQGRSNIIPRIALPQQYRMRMFRNPHMPVS
jgi:hypothetical protein